MISTRYGWAPSKKYIRHLSLLASIALLTSVIISSINIRSAQAHRKPPIHEIPNFPIGKFGALGDARTDNTKAIEAAIAAAVKAKGGNLTAGPGTYCFSGPLTFPSGVTLTGSSMSAVTFKPTKNGAAFILQGSSGISSCTLDAQPGDAGYYAGIQDPNPTQRSVYGSAGARISLSKMNLASIVCIDCNAVVIENCTTQYSVNIFGSDNIILEKDNFADSPDGNLGIYADNKQKPSVGLSLISCTWAPGDSALGHSAGYINVGGGIAKGAYQVIESCNFANVGLNVQIQNDKSVAYTYFTFANNVCAGTAEVVALYLQNDNPHVIVSMTGNQFHTLASPALPVAPSAAFLIGPPVASDVGEVLFSNNDVWAGVICSGGRLSITGNKFSKLGQIQCSAAPQWVGPLTISNNSFSLSGQTSPSSNVVPILVELSPTDSQSVQGPVTIDKNKCTSTVALPGYILVLDAANDKTNVSGNTVTPAGAVTAVVHTEAAFIALLQQFRH